MTPDIFEPTIAPTKNRDGALMIFPDGTRKAIPLDHIGDTIAALQAIQGKLAREDCFRMANIDGGFQRVFGGEG